ncbi:MAG: hypothetical protein AB7P76_10780 [Candidatus Melainabacteria bacterium]
MAELNLDNLIQTQCESMENRFIDLGQSETLIQENMRFVREFAKIAAGLIAQQGGIEIPGAKAPIPFTEETATQALLLFTEGVYAALIKCEEHEVEAELKTNLMQALAMEVYSNALQVVASTFGQENTPEFQFSDEQQIELIAQTAESTLMLYLNELQQQEVGSAIDELTALQEEEDVPPEAQAPAAAAEPPPAAPSPKAPEKKAPAKPVTARTAPARGLSAAEQSRHARYAALALATSMMPARQQATLLKALKPEEVQWVSFYADLNNIEKNLDLGLVNTELTRLKPLLASESARSPDRRSGVAADPNWQTVAHRTDPQKMLLWLQQERATVRRYLEEKTGILLNDLWDDMPEAAPTGEPGEAAAQMPKSISVILLKHLAGLADAS